jgi:hypothetical protein
MERLQNESHEFMLKKIKTFLDKAREEYQENPQDFKKLQELCSTFNDFLLLKKSDEVPSADEEMKNYQEYFDQMNRTISVNFKYLKSKIEGNKETKSVSQAPVQQEQFKASFPVNTYAPPVQVSNEYQVRSSHIPIQKQAKVSVPNRILHNQDQGFFDFTTQNEMTTSHNYTNPQSYSMPQQRNQIYSHNTINVRGVSPGPRTIKTIRVSQRAGTPSRTPDQNSSSNYVETISNINGVKVIRRSISRPRTPTKTSERQTVPTFPSSDQSLNQSQILDSSASQTFVQNSLFKSPVNYTLLYNSKRDGLNVSNFHKMCDQKGPTLCIIKAKETGAVFGGYNNHVWLSNDSMDCLPSNDAFLFSVDKRTKHELTSVNNMNAICCSKNIGPAFGKISGYENGAITNKFDLIILLEGDKNVLSSANLGNTFDLPEGIAKDSQQAKEFLAGKEKFMVEDIEVYLVSERRGYNS